MTKRILSILLAAILCVMSVMTFVSCDDDPVGPANDSENAGGDKTPADDKGEDNENNDDPKGDDASGEKNEDSRYTNYDLAADYDEKTAVKINFTDSKAEIEGDGAAADGTVVMITKPGTYILSGSCQDGQVIVEVVNTEKVQLVLNGLKLVCKSSAPIYIKNADKTSITLAEGTVSTLQDGGNYTGLNADGEPNACLFSKDDLSINGTGTLNVYANYNNGIVSKDDLKLISGVINVTAKNHGIRGNDSVTIKDGTYTISCKNDGFKSSKEGEAGKGYIYIDGGNFTVDSGDDAFQAVTDITVVGGTFSVEAGGNIINCDGTQNIAEGTLKTK